jgi:hypothetical protein
MAVNLVITAHIFIRFAPNMVFRLKNCDYVDKKWLIFKLCKFAAENTFVNNR